MIYTHWYDYRCITCYLVHVCVNMYVPAHCSSLAIMMAVRAASLYCCSAIYRRNRYFASWEEERKVNQPSSVQWTVSLRARFTYMEIV